MPANKKIGLRQATQIRKKLTTELEKCKSANKFLDIQRSYLHDKFALKLFEIDSTLNKKNKDLLNTKDAQIANLFKEKADEFKIELDRITEKRRLEAEQDEQEELVQNQPVLIESNGSDFNENQEDTDDFEDAIGDFEDSIDTTIVTSIENSKPQLNPQRVNDLVDVKKRLVLLSDKSAEFEGKIKALENQQPVDAQKLADYLKAKAAVDSIYKDINGLYENYVYGLISLAELKNDAKTHLGEENEHVQTLQSHRGLKEILINILAAIVGLGIFYGIAAAVKGSFLVFKPATDTGAKLSDLGETIENTSAAPAA